MPINRIVLIVMDSAGIGALPDATKYGDAGANTLGHIAQEHQLHLSNLSQMGLGNIAPLTNLPPVRTALGAFGKMAEASAGKDTTTGHWEMAGIILDQPFPTYPHGFPEGVIRDFEAQIGRPVLGNKVASGTVIIEELGAEHLATGKPIVYTSADSVFQIAAHEEVIPVEELYSMCKTARQLLQGEHGVGRVIARPFVGQPGSFQRTANRHDFSLQPPKDNLLNLLTEAGIPVWAVGKIYDIYAGQGISEHVSIKSNMDGMDKTLAWLQGEAKQGLIFTNLVDFDMVYGHRRNVQGYAAALEAFDARLTEVLQALQPEDVLIVTADHGCDPAHTGSDHTREYVPVLVMGEAIQENHDLGVRATFADLGATVAEAFGLKLTQGTSFWSEIKK